MKKNSAILVTGASGMVGSAIVRTLDKHGYNKLLKPSRKELNLIDKNSINSYFEQNKPEYVFMIAAKVGGIEANRCNPVAFLAENSQIQNNLFEACHKFKTKKNLFLGSSCIYPRLCSQPMKEEQLLTGPLEPTNEAYALAKIMGLKMAKYYHQQFGMLTVCPMPSNIYGTNDHYDLNRCHVLTALVKKFADANETGKKSVELWGTGVAKREFIHVDDVAEGCLFFMDKVDTPDFINLGSGVDISIKNLANKISEYIGFKGSINWDPSKPDGMPRKLLDISQITKLGFRPSMDLDEGIKKTISEYEKLKQTGLVQ